MPSDKTYLVDVSDDAHPRLVATLPAANAVTLTPARCYSVEGVQKDTLRIYDISQPSSPRPLNAGFVMEPQGVDLAEIERDGRRYLVVGCAATPNPKRLGGEEGYSGRSILTLDVTEPATVKIAGSAGPQTSNDLRNPAYGYSAIGLQGRYRSTRPPTISAWMSWILATSRTRAGRGACRSPGKVAGSRGSQAISTLPTPSVGSWCSMSARRSLPARSGRCIPGRNTSSTARL